MNNSHTKNKSLKRPLWVACFSVCLLIVSLVLLWICRNFVSAYRISEIYTDGIFYYISWPIKKAISYFPFSFAEIALYVLIISIPIALISVIIKTIKYTHEYYVFKAMDKPRSVFKIFTPAIRFILKGVSLACIICSAFILFGGINYTSLTFSEKSGLTTEQYSVSQLRELCVYLSKRVSDSRRELVLDPNGTIDDEYIEYNLFKLTDDAAAAYAALPDEFDYLKRDYPPAKPAIGSVIMSNIHITGIYPYVIPEAVVNAQTPIMSLPHTICHEMAHQRGFAREDEANYIAYLACVSSNNALFIYSGYYEAFSYAMNQLYTYDRESWNDIAANTNSGVWLDRTAESEFWDQFKTIDDSVTTSVNNTYLTIMDVDDGVHSYGRMVDLLIASAIKDGIITADQNR